MSAGDSTILAVGDVAVRDRGVESSHSIPVASTTIAGHRAFPSPAVRTSHQNAGSATSIRVETVDDQSSGAWDAFALRHREGTLFHEWAWRDAVCGAFPHEAHYLMASRDRIPVGILPLFLVRSIVAGRMLVSVPYGVGGGTLADNDEAADALLEAAKRIATENRCRSIDLRSARAVHASLPIVDRYVGFRRELPQRVEDVPGMLPRKARAAARNARDKFGLTIDHADEHLRTVWRLHVRNMRRLGSLCYPFRFFEAIADRFGPRCWISVARWNQRVVAGLLTLVRGDTVMPYFYGATRAARHCHAANFIYAATMERAVAAGCRVFDFGRSRVDNEGSFAFKRLQGFEPKPLEYQVCVPQGRRGVELSPNAGLFRHARRVWPWLPLSATQYLGAFLSRHIPG